MTTITESGMTFGPFEPEYVFHIEKSGLYGSLGEGIKTSEFVLFVSGESPQKLMLAELRSNLVRG